MYIFLLNFYFCVSGACIPPSPMHPMHLAGVPVNMFPQVNQDFSALSSENDKRSQYNMNSNVGYLNLPYDPLQDG